MPLALSASCRLVGPDEAPRSRDLPPRDSRHRRSSPQARPRWARRPPNSSECLLLHLTRVSLRPRSTDVTICRGRAEHFERPHTVREPRARARTSVSSGQRQTWRSSSSACLTHRAAAANPRSSSHPPGTCRRAPRASGSPSREAAATFSITPTYHSASVPEMNLTLTEPPRRRTCERSHRSVRGVWRARLCGLSALVGRFSLGPPPRPRDAAFAAAATSGRHGGEHKGA